MLPGDLITVPGKGCCHFHGAHGLLLPLRRFALSHSTAYPLKTNSHQIPISLHIL